MIFYIIINDDLHMKKGKIISQIVHITQKIIEEIIRDGYENFPLSDLYKKYMEWKKYDKTIILKGKQKDINELIKYKYSRHYIDNNKITVVGLLPDNYENNELINNLKLL